MAYLNRKTLLDAGARLSTKWTRLHPEVKNRATQVLAEMETVLKDTGYTLHIFDGWRDLEKQKEYINGGTSFVSDALKSYHPWGLAVDFVFKDSSNNWTWEPGGDCAWYDLTCHGSDWYWSKLGEAIERAGIYLGLDTIKNIVFTVSLSSLKRLTSSQKKHLEKVIYHSVQVNQNFQKLYSTKTGNKITDQFATIGITHDIGKIIMLQYLPQRFNKIVKYQQKNPDIGFYRSEIELGFEGQTHSEIGAYFLNLWNFPEASVFTALFHHSTEEFSEPYKEILDIFAIVNELANKGDGG